MASWQASFRAIREPPSSTNSLRDSTPSEPIPLLYSGGKLGTGRSGLRFLR